MGLDTELNVSWEAVSENDNKCITSISRARVSLLAEHCGIDNNIESTRMFRFDGLVGVLNTLADDPSNQLQHHTMESLLEDIKLPEDINPEDLAIDPERPIVEENVYDLISSDKTGFFAQGISWLNESLTSLSRDMQKSAIEKMDSIYGKPLKEQTDLASILYGTLYFLRSRWYIFVLIALACSVVLWLIIK
jgi:hypothetical protein